MPFKDSGSRKAWYRNNPEQCLRTSARQRLSREQKRVYILEEKCVPCADCGFRYPSYVMDFDHVRGKKLFSISNAADNNVSWQKLKDEIAKCDVVCANCHRERTWGRAAGSESHLH